MEVWHTVSERLVSEVQGSLRPPAISVGRKNPVTLLGLLRFGGLGGSESPAGAFEDRIVEARARVSRFAPHEAEELVVESNARFVDIRERREFTGTGIRGALHLKRSTLEATIERHVTGLEIPLICYCDDGTWSVLAADTLRGMGYRNAGFLIGGLRQWIRFGLPVREVELFDE